VKLSTGLPDLGADIIHILHFCACIFHEDHGVTAFKPILIDSQDFFLMLFSNSQCVLTSFQSKSLCHIQAKTFEGINPIGLHNSSGLHLGRILSPWFVLV
jgi:hypothetical protein